MKTLKEMLKKIFTLTLIVKMFTFAVEHPKTTFTASASVVAATMEAQNPNYLNSTLNPTAVSWDVSFLYNPSYWVVRMEDSTNFSVKAENIYLKKQPSQSGGSPSNVLWINPSDGLLKVSSASSLSTAIPGTTLTAGTGISVTGTNPYTITNTVPDKTVSIASANNQMTVTSSYPGFTLTPYTPTTFTASRAINSSTFQVSTRQATVFYTIRINCTASIGSASSGTVALQYSTDNGSAWVDVGQVENSNTVTLAVVLNSNTTQTGQLSGIIPAGAIVRMNQSSSGTTTITFVRGQETY